MTQKLTAIWNVLLGNAVAYNVRVRRVGEGCTIEKNAPMDEKNIVILCGRSII